MKTLATLAALAIAVPAAAGNMNLIANGDFSAGNTGFTSQYTYAPSASGAGIPEGVYLVDTNAQNVHPSWYSFGDHTSGEGNYLIVNGATSTIRGDSKTAWQQTVTAKAGTKYFFEAWASNICCNSTFGGSVAPSDLTFTVDDGTTVTTLGTFTTNPAKPGVWVGLSNTFTTTAAGPLTLRIVNSNLAASGNDFGIDDLNFGTRSAVPDAATWSLFVAGFALVGTAARRRRTTVAV